ncbi:MAG: ABC transporter substrate-binding protein [Pseudonocardia sp.]
MLVAVAALALAGCGGGGQPADQEGGPDEVSIVISGVSLTQGHLLYAVAADTFQRQDIDVEFTSVAGTSPALATLLSGDADVIGLGASAVVNAVSEGADLVMLGAGAGSSLAVVVRPEVVTASGIGPDAPLAERVEALRGLDIATATPGSATEAFLRALLRQHGIDPERDVNLVNISDFGSAPAGLRAGQYDAIAHVMGFGLEGNIVDGTGTKWISMAEGDAAELDGLMTVTVSTRQWADANPDLAQRTFAALAEADQALRADPDAFRDRLREGMFADTDPATFDTGFAIASKSWYEGALVPRPAFDQLIRMQSADLGEDLSDLSYDDIVASWAQGESP